MSSLQRAIALHEAHPCVDGHNDLPWQFRNRVENDIERLDISQNLTYTGVHTDIPRLRAGRVGAQFWSAYANCARQDRDAVRVTLEQIDVVHRMVEEWSDDFALVRTPAEMMEAFESGKIASMIGIEGGHQIDSSMASLRMYFELGVRYMTLTHNCDTPWVTAQNTNNPHEGLTGFGRQILREMNRLGMFVDLSHVSIQTMRDALDTVTAPLIFSHSNARALCDVNRNVPDEILLRVPENGGVVMVSFYPGFVCGNTIEEVADHIDYIRDLVGIDYVGYGADYDGVSSLPVGLEDVSKYPYLTAELIDRGYSDEDIIKVIGGNLVRAWREMEEEAHRLQQETKPDADILTVNHECRTPFVILNPFEHAEGAVSASGY